MAALALFTVGLIAIFVFCNVAVTYLLGLDASITDVTELVRYFGRITVLLVGSEIIVRYSWRWALQIITDLSK